MAAPYEKLEAWQLSMSLVERCYVITQLFPAAERFGLSSQIRRAVVSMPSNLAEGCCRKSSGAYRNHVAIALGSHAELETCLEIARRLKYLTKQQSDEVKELCGQTGRLLNGLYRSLE